MIKRITLAAMLASAAVASAQPIAQVYDRLRPFDIAMPPVKWRSTEGRIAVIYRADPREVCRTNAGMTTLACTLGRKPNPVVTILPFPSSFADEPFARSMAAAATVEDQDALIRTSCSHDREVYARLVCHEVIGHQLGQWPGDHPGK